MAFNSDSDNDGINEINITPFVDVVLVLLVIFMVTTPIMVKEALNLKLPNSVSSDASTHERIGLSITKNGQYLIDGRPEETEVLKEIITKKFNLNPNLEVIIAADRESMHKDLIFVMDILKQIGIENFAFQIEKIVKE